MKALTLFVLMVITVAYVIYIAPLKKTPANNKPQIKLAACDSFMIPTIDKKNEVYYLTRCGCWKSKLDSHYIYPLTYKYADSLRKTGYTCKKFSVPVEYFN